jgi:hypothetical protein
MSYGLPRLCNMRGEGLRVRGSGGVKGAERSRHDAERGLNDDCNMSLMTTGRGEGTVGFWLVMSFINNPPHHTPYTNLHPPSQPHSGLVK